MLASRKISVALSLAALTIGLAVSASPAYAHQFRGPMRIGPSPSVSFHRQGGGVRHVSWGPGIGAGIVAGAGVSAFHRSGGRARGFFGGYGYGYNCGFGFDCGVYDSGYGYGGVYDGNGYGGSGGFSGYASDPEGAEIPPMIFPTNCWVRRAAYDPSGAHMGQALINLCHPSDNVTVTSLKARAKAPDTGTGTGQPAPLYRSGAPQSPP
jgi:hypothetical protein